MVDRIRATLPNQQQNAFLIIIGLFLFLGANIPIPNFVVSVYLIVLYVVSGFYSSYSAIKVTVVLAIVQVFADICRIIIASIGEPLDSLTYLLWRVPLSIFGQLVVGYLIVSIGRNVRQRREVRTTQPARKSIIFLNVLVVLVILTLVLIQIWAPADQ